MKNASWYHIASVENSPSLSHLDDPRRLLLRWWEEGITGSLAAGHTVSPAPAPAHGRQLPVRAASRGTFGCNSQRGCSYLGFFCLLLHPLVPSSRLGQPHRSLQLYKRPVSGVAGGAGGLTVIHVLSHVFIHSFITLWIH